MISILLIVYYTTVFFNYRCLLFLFISLFLIFFNNLSIYTELGFILGQLITTDQYFVFLFSFLLVLITSWLPQCFNSVWAPQFFFFYLNSIIKEQVTHTVLNSFYVGYNIIHADVIKINYIVVSICLLLFWKTNVFTQQIQFTNVLNSVKIHFTVLSSISLLWLWSLIVGIWWATQATGWQAPWVWDIVEKILLFWALFFLYFIHSSYYGISFKCKCERLVIYFWCIYIGFFGLWLGHPDSSHLFYKNLLIINYPFWGLCAFYILTYSTKLKCYIFWHNLNRNLNNLWVLFLLLGALSGSILIELLNQWDISIISLYIFYVVNTWLLLFFFLNKFKCLKINYLIVLAFCFPWILFWFIFLGLWGRYNFKKTQKKHWLFTWLFVAISIIIIPNLQFVDLWYMSNWVLFSLCSISYFESSIQVYMDNNFNHYNLLRTSVVSYLNIYNYNTTLHLFEYNSTVTGLNLFLPLC